MKTLTDFTDCSTALAMTSSQPTVLVVVNDSFLRRLLSPLFSSDVQVTSYGVGGLIGARFESVLVASPMVGGAQKRWFNEAVRTRLKPGGALIWLDPEYEF